jgi:hypothetical protein
VLGFIVRDMFRAKVERGVTVMDIVGVFLWFKERLGSGINIMF